MIPVFPIGHDDSRLHHGIDKRVALSHGQHQLPVHSVNPIIAAYVPIRTTREDPAHIGGRRDRVDGSALRGCDGRYNVVACCRDGFRPRLRSDGNIRRGLCRRCGRGWRGAVNVWLGRRRCGLIGGTLAGVGGAIHSSGIVIFFLVAITVAVAICFSVSFSFCTAVPIHSIIYLPVRFGFPIFSILHGVIELIFGATIWKI